MTHPGWCFGRRRGRGIIITIIEEQLQPAPRAGAVRGGQHQLQQLRQLLQLQHSVAVAIELPAVAVAPSIFRDKNRRFLGAISVNRGRPRDRNGRHTCANRAAIIVTVLRRRG
jgi:hypothetical protein